MKDENKWNQYTKKDVKEWKEGGLIALGLGLFFLIAGICGMFIVDGDYKEYKNSDDIRTVEATIVDVNHTFKKKYGGEKKEVWEAECAYTIEGKEYKVTSDYEHSVSIGTKVKIEVYRNSKGEYKIPIAKSVFTSGFFKVLYVVLIIFGVFLLGGGVYCLNGSKKIAQALEEKAKERQNKGRS